MTNSENTEDKCSSNLIENTVTGIMTTLKVN